MAKKKEKLPPGKFGELEGTIISTVIESEYRTAKSNNDQQIADFESILDSLEGIRAEKNYNWMSDIHVGIMASHLFTGSAQWASQDFKTRDFVDIYLEGDNPEDKLKSLSAKKCLNNMLNQKDIYHYHKRIRARTINWLFGQVYALLYWEKDVRSKKVPTPPTTQNVPSYDEIGNITYTSQEVPQPDHDEKHILIDRFNYDVFDHRNVFVPYNYAYSAQQKDWIILRSEKSFSDLKKDEQQMGYFNFDLLKTKLKTHIESTTAKESYNKSSGSYGTNAFISRTFSDTKFDILDRYGSVWAKVKERDDAGLPTEIEPGVDEQGVPLDSAELVEGILTVAGVADNWTLIRFQPTWAVDSLGRPFKPIVRGWCYIHPTKDIGLSDGKNLREINVAIDDTFNISNDRVMLATLPTFKGKKLSIENNPTVYIEPEHIIELENPKEDLEELKISDNIQGAMVQIGFLKGMASELDAKWPTTMGGLPEKTSTTATAIAGAETRTNVRSNYESLTWTYTFDVEFYQMILQLVYRFAEPETLTKLVGEALAAHFDPNADYTYVPLSANLEAEHDKMKKVGVYDQMNGRLAGLAKIFPREIAALIAFNVGKQAELLGSEYREIAHLLQALTKAQPQPEGKGAEQTADGKPPATSNQMGMEQSTLEQSARGTMQ